MDKLWLNQYQQGVPHEIHPDSYASLVALFDESFKKHSKNIAFVNMGTTMTYAELDKLSLDFATYLQQLDLKKGARIAIMMPNLLQYPIALFGILRAGYVVVNTNPLYTPDEFTHQMVDSEAEAIVVLANYAHIVQDSLPKIPTLNHVIVTELGDRFPLLKKWTVNFAVKYIKQLVPSYKSLTVSRFNAVLKKGSRSVLKPISFRQDDIAFIQYTGGTTGVFKGAILTHRNMVANILQASAWLSPMSMGKNDTVVTALPLYHIFSLTANCFTFFKIGAKNILITNPRDTVTFIGEIKNTQFTAITGVNTLFNSLLNNPKFKDVDFSKLKLALSGGMALQKSVALKWKQTTKSPILEAYGLTETSPAVTINPLSLKEYNGSIGLPVSSTNISIRDTEGKELPLGETGELCVLGPQVMPGYWKRPDETALVFWPDGYLRTGDSAKVDALGFVYLVDRIKDLIIVSGFNIYPNEVEQVIGQIPGVLEVGVIGVLSEDGLEQVKACVVKKDRSLTAEDIIAYCHLHLTGYKVPKTIEFYNELPKSNVGKVLRRALRK
ncbi:MAG: AMP-binding protein [Legionellaceae bacterium]|nr:AMP-binding protein [Legionellaceae bacterium]